MRFISIVLAIIISFQILYADLPSKIDNYEIISDRFWSSRGDNFWHGGIDIPADTVFTKVYSMNNGKAYWIQYPENNPYNCIVGVGTYQGIGIQYGHVARDYSIKPDTNIINFDTTYIFKSVFIDQYLGTIYHNAPHIHFEYIEKANDTLNWWAESNKNYLKEPMEYYFHNDYSSNLQTPQFYWLDTNDIGDETKIGRFIPKGSFSDVYRDSVENLPVVVYGGVQLQVAPGCFNGVWSNRILKKSDYNPARIPSRDSLVANNNNSYYSMAYWPEMAVVYNLGYKIGNDFGWQFKGDNFKEYVNIYNLHNSIFVQDGQDGITPDKMYVFTNSEINGELTGYLPDIYWSTNMKEGIEGFYVNIMEDTAEVAKSNLKAKYKDGLNWVHLYASSYSTENTNEMGRDSVPVILDNFSPAADTEVSVVKTPREEENIVGVIDIEPYDIIELKLQMTEKMDTSKYSGGMYYYTGSKIYLDTINFKKISLTYDTNTLVVKYRFKPNNTGIDIVRIFYLKGMDEAENRLNSYIDIESYRDTLGNFIDYNPFSFNGNSWVEMFIYRAQDDEDSSNIPETPLDSNGTEYPEPPDSLIEPPDSLDDDFIKKTMFYKGEPKGTLGVNETGTSIAAYFISNYPISVDSFYCNGNNMTPTLSGEKIDSVNYMYKVTGYTALDTSTSYQVTCIVNNGTDKCSGGWSFGKEKAVLKFVSGKPVGTVEYADKYFVTAIFSGNVAGVSPKILVNEHEVEFSLNISTTDDGDVITTLISKEINFQEGTNSIYAEVTNDKNDEIVNGKWNVIKDENRPNLVYCGVITYYNKLLFPYPQKWTGCMYTIDNYKMPITSYTLNFISSNNTVYPATSASKPFSINSSTIVDDEYDNVDIKQGRRMIGLGVTEYNIERAIAKNNSHTKKVGIYYYSDAVGGLKEVSLDVKNINEQELNLNSTDNLKWEIIDSRLIATDTVTNNIIYRECSFGVDNWAYDTLLNNPQDLAVDENYLYVADTYNNYIKIFDKSNGNFLGKFGGTDTLGNDRLFRFPEVIIKNDSNICVIDNYGTRMKYYTLGGQFIKVDTIDIYQNATAEHPIKFTAIDDELFDSIGIDTIKSSSIIYTQRNLPIINKIYLKLNEFGDSNEFVYDERELTTLNHNAFNMYGFKGKRNSYYRMILNGECKNNKFYSDTEDVYLKLDIPTVKLYNSTTLYSKYIEDSLKMENYLNGIAFNVWFSRDSNFGSEDTAVISSIKYAREFNQAIYDNELYTLYGGTWYFKARYVQFYEDETIYGDYSRVKSIIIPDTSAPKITLSDITNYMEKGRKNISLNWTGYDKEGIKYYKVYLDTSGYRELIDSSEVISQINIGLTEDVESLKVRIEAFDGTNVGYAETGWIKAIRNITFNENKEARLIDCSEKTYNLFKSDSELFIFKDSSGVQTQEGIGVAEIFDADEFENRLFVSYMQNETLFVRQDAETQPLVSVSGMNIEDISKCGERIYYADYNEITGNERICWRSILERETENELINYARGPLDTNKAEIECIYDNGTHYTLIDMSNGKKVLYKEDSLIYETEEFTDKSIVSFEEWWDRLDINMEDELSNQTTVSIDKNDFSHVESREGIRKCGLTLLDYIYYEGGDGLLKRSKIYNSDSLNLKTINSTNKLQDAEFEESGFFGISCLLTTKDTLSYKKFIIMQDTLDEVYVSESYSTSGNNADHIIKSDSFTIVGVFSNDKITFLSNILMKKDDLNVLENMQADIHAPALTYEGGKAAALWTYNGDIYASIYANGVWSLAERVLDADITDSLYSTTETSGYHSISCELRNDTLHFTGIYTERSSNPQVPVMNEWFYGKYGINNPDGLEIFGYDTLISGQIINPTSPVIKTDKYNRFYISYEKTDNVGNDRLYYVYPKTDNAGAVIGYNKKELGYGSYPDMYSKGFGNTVVYFDKINNYVMTKSISNLGYVSSTRIIDSVETGETRPVIEMDRLYYEKDGDIYYAQMDMKGIRYVPVGPVTVNLFTKSNNPTVGGYEIPDAGKYEYNLIWSEGEKPTYLDYYIDTITELLPDYLYLAGDSLNEEFVLNRDSVVVTDTLDPYLNFDMSKVELEYLFMGIKNGEYILSTYYYYPAPADVSGVKDGQDEFSIMKTVNEESNKEKISIPYGTIVEDSDTISIEDGELSLSIRKNSSGPAVMSVMMLDELDESEEAAAMSIKQMKLKDIEKFEIASKNIFRHTLVMQFVTAGEKDISIKIYNKLGAECRKLFDGKSKDGYNAIIWDGKDGKGGMLASGEYFVVYESGDKRVVKKVELIK